MTILNKIKKYVDTTSKIFVTATLLHINMIYCIQIYLQLGPQTIFSESQLEQVINNERKKLDPNNKFGNYKIQVNFSDKREAYSKKSSNDNYEICIGGNGAVESVARHELYHIFDSHCDEKTKYPIFQYIYIDEPKATIYEAIGKKF